MSAAAEPIPVCEPTIGELERQYVDDAVRSGWISVDSCPTTWPLDPTQLEAARSPHTRAVLSVTMYGHPSDFDAIAEFCRRHGLAWVEDAAEGHGATYRGRPLAGFADLTAYS